MCWKIWTYLVIGTGKTFHLTKYEGITLKTPIGNTKKQPKYAQKGP